MKPEIKDPIVLDLYSGAGGCSYGYYLAGYHPIGVDISRQGNYPFVDFIQSDALYLLGRLLMGDTITTSYDRRFTLADVALIHASPPCQFGTHLKALHQTKEYAEKHPNLIPQTRALLKMTDCPYVIENVAGARKHLISPIMLCGTMFGLQTSEGSQLRRHRYFEIANYNGLILTPKCNHNDGSAIGVHGGGQHPGRRRPATINVTGHAGGYSQRDQLDHYGVDARREAMGIEWMTQDELSEAIPPAYCEYIGKHLIATFQRAQAGEGE